MKTNKEITDMLNVASDQAMGESKCFGMTYEQGVEAALMWVLGLTDEDRKSVV